MTPPRRDEAGRDDPQGPQTRPPRRQGHPPGAVFLERSTYRRRRLADAAALLPLLGAVLLILPLLWQANTGAPGKTSHVMFYIFGIWALLAVLSGLVSRHLDRDRAAGPDAPDADDTPRPGAG